MLTTWLTSDDKNDFIPHKFTRVMENGGKSIYPMCIKTEWEKNHIHQFVATLNHQSLQRMFATYIIIKCMYFA